MLSIAVWIFSVVNYSFFLWITYPIRHLFRMDGLCMGLVMRLHLIFIERPLKLHHKKSLPCAGKKWRQERVIRDNFRAFRLGIIRDKKPKKISNQEADGLHRSIPKKKPSYANAWVEAKPTAFVVDHLNK